MKWLILILALGLSACASPKKFDVPSTVGVRQALVETRSHIGMAKTTAGAVKQSILDIQAKEQDPELVLQLGQAAAQIDSLTNNLLTADTAAEALDTRLAQVEQQIVKLAQNAQKAETERAKAVSRYHRLKLPLCLIGAAVAGFFLWKFKPAILALGPWGIAGAAAAPVGVFSLLWLIL